MIPSYEVSAVIVTNGDVPLSLQNIRSSLPFRDVVVWDNSRLRNLGIYGRYAAIREARNPYIYVQDDDVMVTDWKLKRLLEVAETGEEKIWALHATNGEAQLGQGAIFHRKLPEIAFLKWWQSGHSRSDDEFCNVTCDFVFASTIPCRVVFS